jgi:hypothetical protein
VDASLRELTELDFLLAVDVLRYLVGKGTSLGGMRPKCNFEKQLLLAGNLELLA